MKKSGQNGQISSTSAGTYFRWTLLVLKSCSGSNQKNLGGSGIHNIEIGTGTGTEISGIWLYTGT
jgi:hypothetical protein